MAIAFDFLICLHHQLYQQSKSQTLVSSHAFDFGPFLYFLQEGGLLLLPASCLTVADQLSIWCSPWKKKQNLAKLGLGYPVVSYCELASYTAVLGQVK